MRMFFYFRGGIRLQYSCMVGVFHNPAVTLISFGKRDIKSWPETHTESHFILAVKI